MEFTDIVYTGITKVPSYADTLKAIPVGETRYYRAIGATYHGMHSAKSRAAAEGRYYDIELLAGGTTLKVTRNS